MFIPHAGAGRLQQWYTLDEIEQKATLTAQMTADATTHGAFPSPDADALVDRARAGDSDAFAILFRLTNTSVFRTLYARAGDRALAEDLTSETYIRAIRSISSFDGGSRDFLAWILRIGRNLFLDHVKSGRVRWETVIDEMPVAASGEDPESVALARVEAIRLRAALGRLTPEQQEVVHLRFLEGLSVAEVAEITGRADGAVKALQFRALKSLARVLEDPTAAVE